MPRKPEVERNDQTGHFDDMRNRRLALSPDVLSGTCQPKCIRRQAATAMLDPLSYSIRDGPEHIHQLQPPR
jgi:hypothetical protein